MNEEIKEVITEEVEQIENLVEHPTSKKNKFVISMVIIAVVLTSAGFLFFRPKQSSTKNDDNSKSISQSYTLSEISSHNSKEDCWTAIEGNVYNITGFLGKHKGGDKILAVCGKDGTDLVNGNSKMGRTHSPMAYKVIESSKIGTLSK